MFAEACLQAIALQGHGPFVPLSGDVLSDHWLATTLAEGLSSNLLNLQVSYFMELWSCLIYKFRFRCANSMDLWIYDGSSGSAHTVMSHLTKAQSLSLHLKRACAILLTNCVAAYVVIELVK